MYVRVLKLPGTLKKTTSLQILAQILVNNMSRMVLTKLETTTSGPLTTRPRLFMQFIKHFLKTTDTKQLGVSLNLRDKYVLVYNIYIIYYDILLS